MEQSVQLLALLKQSSVEQERTAHFSLLLHVEDEVPEVHARYFLPGVLPGGGRAQPGLAATTHPHTLQENTPERESCSSKGLPPLPGLQLLDSFKQLQCIIMSLIRKTLHEGFFYYYYFFYSESLTKLT